MVAFSPFGDSSVSMILNSLLRLKHKQNTKHRFLEVPKETFYLCNNQDVRKTLAQATKGLSLFRFDRGFD